MYPRVILKPGKEQSIQRFHPWVFSGAIRKIEGSVADGVVVEVFDASGEYLATGHFQNGSIAVRIFCFSQSSIDTSFWLRKLKLAYDFRQRLGFIGNARTNIFRLIHGEGDGFPGLIVDVYGSTAVIQAHSVGMYAIRNLIAELIVQVSGQQIKSVFDKSSVTVSGNQWGEAKDGYLFGNQVEELLFENGNRFEVSWEEGQKTGFFIDQRDNRSLLELYSKNAAVLNTFCYTGGFSVYALRGGATRVVSVDSSSKAIELTNRNIDLNFGDNQKHQSQCVDVFEFLKNNHDTWDVIVLDPPAFAKSTHSLKNALQAYKRLNANAFRRLKPGGILFTFSCSQVVSREQFRNAVFSGSIIAQKQVRILHQLTQPADHPINIYHPEGEYLKGLVLEVSSTV